MAFCKYHPDRPGVGICVRCRAVICSDCRTRVDGINHCHACLKALGRSSETRGRFRISQTIAAGFLLFIAWLFFLGVFWQAQGTLAP
jgi:hypothetical protein